ncbi:nitroreductase family deazaflavin-dependent oxidoreductase [Nocardioides sp. Iso805N]|uniref:nitroreductase family deazaflavin-dependent oxidoreductase n=1 Tax=Nocardioides sp. Iso805N TaxID=1283287 RepID=UPI00037FACBD|nr:nitroreductase family deazaflavin-dependent oxidoreductase [Nocardioides sp. Iso805N]
MSDGNTQVIEEFRANQGRVGGPFEGAPMVLVHHTGRRSGAERVTPLVYLPGDDASVLYIFASKGGAPTNPDWYRNLIETGTTTIEVGAETYQVSVEEVTGAERDRLFAGQVARMPGFGGYAEKTAGIRVIPVLRLTRS